MREQIAPGEFNQDAIELHGKTAVSHIAATWSSR